MNRDVLRRRLAKLLWSEYFCCICGDKQNLIQQMSTKNTIFWICVQCLEECH